MACMALFFSHAFAQKLPSVQKASVFAPINIKIDGKANEWNDQFQAYNNATDIFYTLANDNDNLYLVLRTTYHDVIDKIVRGGISIVINHSTAKKDPNAVSITYPALRDNDMAVVSNMLARKFFPKANGDTASVVNVDDLNQLIGNKSKQINTTGISTIEDNNISVYNDKGLKAAELFNNKLQYTCEIAIPLKYLSLPDGQPFSYQIKVNAPVESKPHILAPGERPPPPIMITTAATTDFWGEYKLARK